MQPSGGGSILDSLNKPTAESVQHSSYHSASHVAKGVEDRPHRRHSLQIGSSMVDNHDWKCRDGISPDIRRRLASQTNKHEQKRRHSLSIAPSSRDKSPGPDGRRSSQTTPSPTRTSFQKVLPIAHERHMDTDLDSFRLARACGMTLDTISVAKPRQVARDVLQEGELEAEDKSATSDRSAHPKRDEPGDRYRSRQKERTSSQVRERRHSLFERPSRHDDLKIPSPRSTPSSPTSSPLAKRPGTPVRPNRPAPPFAPPLDPQMQLACIDGLLKEHQDIFNASGVFQSTESISIEVLVDVKRLLEEHEIDSRVENARRRKEHEETGLDFFERIEKARSSEDQGTGPSWRSPMAMVDLIDGEYHVFGQPLSLTRLYASCVCSVAGYQHDLPIVVYACVEQLYRTGMTVSGLFRSPPDRVRHDQLIGLFDNGPSFGRLRSLSKERTADICALLRSYIDRLPRAVWHETLFDPMLKLCVWPSLLVEKALAESSENEDEDEATNSGQPQKARPTSLIIPRTPELGDTAVRHGRSSSLDNIIPFNSSLSASALSAMALTDIDLTREKPQLTAARALFRLLPRAQLALLAYLCAFFTQLPLCPHNQLTIEDLARLFAVPLFLGKADGAAVPTSSEEWARRKDDARTMMIWILRRWTHISEGLFDADDAGISVGETEPSSASSSDDSESVQTDTSNLAWSGQDNHGLDNARVNGDMDIFTWKSHVEKDIDELKRALSDVRSHLQK